MDSRAKEIILERGLHGLGFNIRGGVDIPYLPGETGIFVTKIREDGAAFKDGRLQEGDKILEVNGTKLERVTHNEAVQAFINAGETVILQVIAGEEARINKKLENDRNDSSTQGPSQGGGGVVSILGVGVVVIGIAVAAYFAYTKYRR